MEITKLINRNGELMGAFIEDTGDTYPVAIEALQTRTIVDELLKSGYELTGLPYSWSKNGVSIMDLPRVEFSEANISETEEQDMYLGLSDKYTVSELTAMIKIDENTELHEWATGENRLKTREDLESFLKLIEQGKVPNSNPYSYLPLNYFVSKVALYSPEEYFSVENVRWRTVIENRRILDVTQIKHLVAFLKENAGLPEHYTPSQLMDAYYSWGICGLKFKVIGFNKVDSDILLGADYDFSQDESTMPYRRKYHNTYLDSKGVIHREGAYNSSAWVTSTPDSMINNNIAKIREQGFNYIMLEKLSSKIVEQVTEIAGNDIKISYDSTTLMYDYDNKYIVNGLRIKSPTNDSRYLDSRCLNIDTIDNEVRLEALCYYIKDKTTVRCDKSSWDALRTAGMSHMSAMYYMVNHTDIKTKVESVLEEENASLTDICFGMTPAMREEAANKYGPQDALVMFQDYLVGNLEKQSLKYKVSKCILDEFYNGTLNIDNTGSGEVIDMYVDAIDTYKNSLDVVQTYLGLSYGDIYRKIADVTIDTSYIDFESADGSKVLRLPIKCCNNKYNGYRTDLENYRLLAGEQANIYTYVTGVLRELGNGSNERYHVGIEMNWIDLNNKKNYKLVEPLLDRIEITIKEAIEKHCPEHLKNKIYRTIGFMKAEALFALLNKGKYKLNENYLGGIEITANLEERCNIRDTIENRLTTPITYCDSVVNAAGDICIYCTNAQIMEDVVVPRGEGIIPEKPFIPLWIETTDSPSWVATRERWFTKGYLPLKNWIGYSLRCKELEIPQDIDFDGKPYNINNDNRSLVNYYKVANEFIANYPEDKELINPPSPYSNMYIDQEYELDVTLLQPRQDGDTGKHSWAISKMLPISKADILERFPYLREIFKPERLELTNEHGYSKVSITADDLFRTSVNVCDIFDDVEGEIITKVLPNGQVEFADGNIVPWNDLVDTYNTGKYAIKQLHGNKFLCLTGNKTWIEGVV